ncbi:nitrate transporter [Exidia glandulosa HHB12029]|uniref:Nitrate/nitrite transporter n=1 Tax=Exidia glandulosa HHB12029 TaxID=1314781 RepID=A0A165IE04_EXIGL|nr:nitrate transporter [Exidia glandulosa HHB12029]
MSDSSETDAHRAEPDTHYRRTGLWERLTTTRVNPLNLKCETLPVFSLKSQYARNFHLSWFAFWVAFLSWFAFAPLIPEAVKDDLKLTPAQIGNSNICALCATLIVRLIVGPLVDRFGPRRVMAALLAIGAIPSGLAGLVTSVPGLYAVRFFIGILGGTFVPCQAWTTTFFDKKIVGTANALVGGWGNSGGGFTFIIMVALYERLLRDGLSPHSAWRAAFAIVPVPVLLGTSVLVMVFGTDHPAGRWSERYNIPAARTASDPEQSPRDRDVVEEKKDTPGIDVTVSPASPQEAQLPLSAVDTAVNQELTAKIAAQILANPLTWLPSAAYATTFGYELAIDAYLANILFGLYKSDSFGQTKAGYVASVFGMLNIFTRPMGGYLGDIVYRRFGVAGKKYLTLLCGFLRGVFSLGLGLYLERGSHPSLDVVVVFIVIIAIFNEAGNGANFALVPHCNSNYNGFMSGMVGAAGNVGGIIFAVIFRFRPVPVGHAFWISGIIAMGVNVLLMTIRVPKW